MNFQKRNWWYALLLMAGTVAAYWPVLHCGFIWDDDALINPVVKQADGLFRLWFTASTPDYFPATSSSLWVEWRLWGMNPMGYHLTNVLLHALSAVLLWRILKLLQIPGAWLAAAIFAVHPVNVESVAWIAERKNTLSMFFYLASLLFYVKSSKTASGQRAFYWLAVLTFALALLSKTAVVMMPFVLLGIAWWERNRIEHRDIWRAIPFFILSTVMGLVGIWFQSHQVIRSAIVREGGFWPRLAGAGWALWFYLYKLFIPLKLIFVYPRWNINAAHVFAWLPGVLFVCGLAVCWRHRSQWGKAWLFGLGYFALMLFPVLGFFDILFMIYSLVADHWQYFAMIGPVTLAAAFLASKIEKSQGWKIVTGALLLALAALTWRQIGMYANADTLWRATIAANPSCWMACENLAEADLRQNRLDEATEFLEKAVALHPGDTVACTDLGFAYLRKGRMREAIEYLRQGVESTPNDAKARYNLGRALLLQGRVAEAVLQLEKTLDIDPSLREAHDQLGEALLQMGQSVKAMVHFQKSIELKPDNFVAYKNLAESLVQQGRAREAIVFYQKAIALRPDFVDALNDLAWLLATHSDASVRNGAQALALANRANTLTEGKDAGIIDTVAAAYAETGDFPQAAAAAQHALDLAHGQQRENLASKIETHLKLYQAGTPLRDGN